MQHQFYSNLPLLSFFFSFPISDCAFDTGSVSLAGSLFDADAMKINQSQKEN